MPFTARRVRRRAAALRLAHTAAAAVALTLCAAALATRGAHAATSVVIEVNGINNDVTTVNTTTTGWLNDPSNFYNDPFWWNEISYAQSACNTVAAQLGYANQLGPSGTYGPYFAYGVQFNERRRQLRQVDGWYYFAYYNETSACEDGFLPFNSVPDIAVFAYSTVVPSPSPEASPSSLPDASPSPSPDPVSPSPSPSPDALLSPSPDPVSPSPSPSPDASLSPSPEAASPSPSPEASPSPSPDAFPSPSPDASPSPSPEAASPSPEMSPSSSPEASPSPSSDTSPSPSPDASPSPSPEAASPSPSSSLETWSPSPSPEASPSPLPLPDCNQATFDPPLLMSRRYPIICAANKEARTGRRVRFATNVTLSVPGAAVNITNIVLDKASAGWKCRCRPTRQDTCACVPNAALMGGGLFRVMPQWRRDIAAGRVADTILQVSFTATTQGSTCAGEAVLCSVPDTRRNKPPSDCRRFNSTGVSRPALTCI